MENVNPFPDESRVHVWYAGPGLGMFPAREDWRWYPGQIVSRVGDDEWEVVVLDDEVMRPDEETGEMVYPVCFRDRKELRRHLPPDVQGTHT